MSCIPPYRGDTSQMLLFKIASCLSGGDESGPVQSFNGRGGVVTLTFTDVVGALGCTPACDNNVVTSFNGRQGVVTLTSGDVTTALGFTPLSQAAGDARYVLKTGDTMTGALNINTGIIAANGPALALTQTWNNAGVTFTGLSLNVTDTASTSGSFLFDVQKDALSKFHVTNAGTARFMRQDQTNTAFQLFLRKTGNSVSSTGAIASGGGIGTLFFSGFNGTGNVQPSSIQAIAAEAFTNLVNGTRLDFFTTPIGTNTAIVALSLLDTGAAAFRDGTAALPSITFASGSGVTGLYRIAAGSMGLTASGVLTLAVSTTGVNLTSGLAYQYNSVNVIRAQTALGNYHFGPSGNLTMTGTNNISVGGGALNANTSGTRNVAIGASSLLVNTTGTSNLAIGTVALFSNVAGDFNTAVGDGALQSNTSSNNVAIGTATLSLNTTGNQNSAVGTGALGDVTTGTKNSALGYSTGRGITTGSNNTVLGANVTGLAAALSNNIIIADGAGNQRINVDSSGNTVLAANLNIPSGSAYQYNSVNVIRAQTALNNFYFGASGNLTATGANNLGLGASSLAALTSGINNVAVGTSALASTTTGSNNVALGVTALQNNTTGSSNFALGTSTLLTNTVGSTNVAIGDYALGVATASSNIAIGFQALLGDTTGSKNLAFGSNTLLNVTTGAQNTALGYNTGLGITTGSNNTIIGANVTGLAAALSNNIIIADGAGNQRLNIDSSGNTTLTGTLAIGNGTAALPAFTFSSDLTTGIYRIGANVLGFSTAGTARWQFNASGHLLATTDATYDIGAAGATRPRVLYLSSTIVIQSQAVITAGGADGTILFRNNAATDFGLVKLGGTTSSFPALKRNGAGIDFRLADDSAYAVITTAGHIMSAGAPISVTSGANQRAGNAVLVGGTVTVANTTITANTIVILTRKTAGGVLGNITYTLSAATSFTINSDNALDTSTVSYLLIEVP